MKQGYFIIPKNKIPDFCKFLAENSVMTNASWLEGGESFFSEQKMHIIVCFPDDKEDKMKANWGANLKTK